ncbi:MAG: hypothetical protein IKH88_18330 [Prevotella sp.]|nr:hypothetical protein [Prevotella sp.]
MNNLIKKFNQKELGPRDSALLKEWEKLDALCSKRRAESSNPLAATIAYTIKKKNIIGLPVVYEIWYRVRSIVGVEETEPPRKPVFGNLHKMLIKLPNNYPAADGNPIFTFRTDIWHPNIRHSGSFKGHVCLTIKDLGVMASLRDLVLRVEKYLKYESYHAKNIYPYPEDLEVAEWVREEAEPNGWTKFPQNTPGDTPPVSSKKEAGKKEDADDSDSEASVKTKSKTRMKI